ncbi:MAG: T9SS type A sorting domain-containing protein [Chitinophagaceae bacterium]|jgi:hypothetical protein|nr:T9SS type A sorting domain-containing protein [Chitinophagaceae bacterium]
MKRCVLLLFVCSLLSATVFSNVKTAFSNNNNGWSVNSNWLPSGMPANGDTIIIPAFFTLNVKGNLYNGPKPRLIIYVYGTLDFDPSGKLDLADQSEIYVFTGGSIRTNGTSSEQITINNVLKYNGQNDGNVSGPIFASAATGISPGGFSVFNILPVSVLAFSHDLSRNNLVLHWTLKQGTGNETYYLESKRHSGDWKVIQSNKIQDITSEVHSHDYKETIMTSGTYEYRLKFPDANGYAQYSKIIKVNLNQPESLFKVYPNPATSVLEFNFDIPLENGQIHFTSASGKIVYTTPLISGFTSKINISHLPKGVYTVSLSGNNERYSEMLVIR